MLNATKLRRYLWAEIPTMSIDQFTLPKDSDFSKCFEGHGCFRKVDTQGHWHPLGTKTKKPKFIPVDGLIKMCRKHYRNVYKEDREEVYTVWDSNHKWDFCNSTGHW